ncbi:3-oxoacyl-[acyl-carrier-protein] synthase II [Luteibacter sp. UNCMF331Sha3.1]|nr:3-oxoacyl-[acyl-carrier-protein] synthase II [Luteibacter sp. UNCMF331Sha3.1]
MNPHTMNAQQHSTTGRAPKRVVVTGFGGITPLGHDWPTIAARLRAGRNAIRRMGEWDYFDKLNGRLGAPVDDFVQPAHWSRKHVRSMGRVAQLAVAASERALTDAGLLGDARITDGRMGVAYGSSGGSIEPARTVGRMLETGSMQGVTATSYIQMMAHTTAVNVGVFFGLKGRVVTTSSACTSGSQAIGYGYEAIQQGKQSLMLCGGAEELSGPGAAVFDTLFATSTRNDEAGLTPRPFDARRDGLVVGEGATTLVLEEYEHAVARGARIYAEIVGFGTNSDGAHITQPTRETMAAAMRMALDDAGLDASAIGYVSAHGTATDRGDVAESHATADVLGGRVPISSMKSYVGHTLGACGALESWWAIEMMRSGWFAPTINLDTPDPECAALDYIAGEGREIRTGHVMNNNFAFGGINTSLIFRAHP